MAHHHFVKAHAVRCIVILQFDLPLQYPYALLQTAHINYPFTRPLIISHFNSDESIKKTDHSGQGDTNITYISSLRPGAERACLLIRWRLSVSRDEVPLQMGMQSTDKR